MSNIDDKSVITRKLIIAALPRSGTTLVSNVLCSAGLNFGHEHIVNPRLGAGAKIDFANYQGDVGYSNIPFLEEFSANPDVCVVYQQRSPLAQINTFARVAQHNWTTKMKNAPAMSFMYEHTPKLQSVDNAADWAVQFWLQWTAMMDEVEPEYSFRVEDGPAGLAKALELAGLDTKPLGDKFGTGTNSFGRHGQRAFTWNTLPAEIKQRAIDLGYDVA